MQQIKFGRKFPVQQCVALPQQEITLAYGFVFTRLHLYAMCEQASVFLKIPGQQFFGITAKPREAMYVEKGMQRFRFCIKFLQPRPCVACSCWRQAGYFSLPAGGSGIE